MMLLAQQPDPARLAQVLAGLLCVLGVALVIGTLIGAVVLRTACWLYNLFVGGAKSRDAVPMPDFGKAMGIAFVAALVNMGTSFVVGLVVGGGMAAMGKDLGAAQSVAQLVAVPVSFLVLAGMISGMLPTSFGRAALVALLYLAIAIIITVVILVMMVIVFAAIGAGLPR